MNAVGACPACVRCALSQWLSLRTQANVGLWAAQAEQMMPGEVDNSADGADEAEQEQRYARCKPLAPVDSARWHAGEPSRLGHIFYGNDNFFIFFRLHQHLCDRHTPHLSCISSSSSPSFSAAAA